MSAADPRLVRVDTADGPVWAVHRGERYDQLGMTLAELLRLPRAEARRAVEAASAEISPLRALAPVDPHHEVWATGVTYLRSRDGRIEEATDGTPYDRVYAAERPELFFKSIGWRAVTTGDPIGVRADSAWNTPEPELVLVLDSAGEVFGYAVGDDVSSRSIEGENLLYLPQAKVFTSACAIGPEIAPAWTVEPPFAITLAVERGGETVVFGETSTSLMARAFDDLAGWLFRALEFPDGALLFTGTGIVPDAEFTLTPGDTVTVTIEGIGALRNTAVEVGTAG